MTRPIFEPNEQREIAAGQFATQQLFRRPAPTSGATGQLPYAVMEYLSGVTIPDNSRVILDLAETGNSWDDGYINAAGLAMTPQPFDFDFDLGRITFNSSGLYHAELMVNWCDTVPNPTFVATVLDYFGNCPIGNNCGDWINFDYLNNNGEFQQNWYFASALWIHVQSIDGAAYIRGQVGQVSGGDLDMCGASLIITKLADYNADGEFLPP